MPRNANNYLRHLHQEDVWCTFFAPNDWWFCLVCLHFWWPSKEIFQFVLSQRTFHVPNCIFWFPLVFHRKVKRWICLIHLAGAMMEKFSEYFDWTTFVSSCLLSGMKSPNTVRFMFALPRFRPSLRFPHKNSVFRFWVLLQNNVSLFQPAAFIPSSEASQS